MKIEGFTVNALLYIIALHYADEGDAGVLWLPADVVSAVRRVSNVSESSQQQQSQDSQHQQSQQIPASGNKFALNFAKLLFNDVVKKIFLTTFSSLV